MDKEHNIFKMVINMKESLKKIKDLEKEMARLRTETTAKKGANNELHKSISTKIEEVSSRPTYQKLVASKVVEKTMQEDSGTRFERAWLEKIGMPGATPEMLMAILTHAMPLFKKGLKQAEEQAAEQAREQDLASAATSSALAAPKAGRSRRCTVAFDTGLDASSQLILDDDDV